VTTKVSGVLAITLGLAILQAVVPMGIDLVRLGVWEGPSLVDVAARFAASNLALGFAVAAARGRRTAGHFSHVVVQALFAFVMASRLAVDVWPWSLALVSIATNVAALAMTLPPMAQAK
jgi:hypothetical protein